MVERREGETEEKINSASRRGRKRGTKWIQRGRHIGREID
jgi:hypothetical protein